MILTYRYRIKDRASKKELARMAGQVNYVWNFCVNTTKQARRWRRWWPSANDLNNLTAGSSKSLKIHSQTIQAICEGFAKSRDEHKKYLNIDHTNGICRGFRSKYQD